MRRHVIAPALLLAAGLSLVGCAGGGGDEKPAKEAATPTITCESSTGEAKTVQSLEAAWELSDDQRFHCTTELPESFEPADSDKAAMVALGESEDDLDTIGNLYSLCAMYNFNNDPGEDLSGDDRDLLNAYAEACPDQPEIESVTAAISKQDAEAEKKAKAKEKAEAKQRALEDKAIETAYGEQDDEDYDDYGLYDSPEEERTSRIELLSDMCKESMLGYEEQEEFSESQVDEVSGALVLCPDHKDASKVKKLIKTSRAIQEQRDNGTRFTDGTYRVGDDIQPGTYVVQVDEDETAFSGCYWERTDANGNIIDNNFINSGFRAQAIVGASDYSFSSNECGEWVKQ
ncbi:hypothetical protein [Galactobacter sp.]|uniref:hypothetical protein n=1 Tax=Galactobacter sp. TaxID=2676125 RepID=UPI0025BBA870|nr:hypothetical protein [Galactobacter sp.]